jgi:hypothetical protein
MTIWAMDGNTSFRHSCADKLVWLGKYVTDLCEHHHGLLGKHMTKQLEAWASAGSGALFMVTCADILSINQTNAGWDADTQTQGLHLYYEFVTAAFFEIFVVNQFCKSFCYANPPDCVDTEQEFERG